MALKGRSYVDPIIRRGADFSAPVNNGGPVPGVLIVTAPARPWARPLVAMSSAPADIFLGTVAVVAAQPQRALVARPLITQNAQDQAPPPPTTTTTAPLVVTVRTRPRTSTTFTVRAPLAPVVVTTTTAAPVLVPVTRRRHRVPAPLIRRGADGVGAGPSIPDVDTPTSLTLDDHNGVLTLDAHAGSLTLDAHSSALSLDAHDSSLTLDEHGTSLELDS